MIFNEIEQLQSIFDVQASPVRIGPPQNFFPGQIHRLEGPHTTTAAVQLALMSQQLDQHQVAAGMLFEQTPGQKIFVPRKSDLSTGDLASVIQDLIQYQTLLTIEQGEIGRTIGGIRTLVRELGLEEPFTPAEDKGHVALKWLEQPLKIRLDSDSFGKEQWRHKILESMRLVFPGGYESIPEKDRLVICFPGRGKEADLWLQYGFKPEELVFIERDKLRAEKLRIQYRGAHLLNRDFLAATLDLPDLVGKLGKRVCVLNIDPESKLTSDFYFAIEGCLKDLPLAPRCLFGTNFFGNREGQKQKNFYRFLASSSPETPMPLSELRKAALRKLASKAVEKSKKNTSPELLFDGSYEGDSSLSRMYWALWTITSGTP